MPATAEEREAKVKLARRKLKKFQAARSHATTAETSPLSSTSPAPLLPPDLSARDPSTKTMNPVPSADLLYGGFVDSYYAPPPPPPPLMPPPPIMPPLPTPTKQLIHHQKTPSTDDLALIIRSYQAVNSQTPSDLAQPEISIPPLPSRHPSPTPSNSLINNVTTQTHVHSHTSIRDIHAPSPTKVQPLPSPEPSPVPHDNTLIALRARIAVLESHLDAAHAKVDRSNVITTDARRRLAETELALSAANHNIQIQKEKLSRDVAESRKVMEAALAERVETTKDLEDAKVARETFRKKVILLQKMLDEEMSKTSKARSREADTHLNAALEARQEAEATLQRAQHDSFVQADALRIQGAQAVAALKNDVMEEWARATRAREEAENLIEEIKSERRQTSLDSNQVAYSHQHNETLKALEAKLEERQKALESAEAALIERQNAVGLVAENAEKELNAALEKSNLALPYRAQNDAMLLQQRADAEMMLAVQRQQEVETERSVVITAAEQERLQLQADPSALRERELVASELEARMRSINSLEDDTPLIAHSRKASLVDDANTINIAAALRDIEAEKNALERERAALDLRETHVAAREQQLVELSGITEIGGHPSTWVSSPTTQGPHSKLILPPRPASPQPPNPMSLGVEAELQTELPVLRHPAERAELALKQSYKPTIRGDPSNCDQVTEPIKDNCADFERTIKHLRIAIRRLTETLDAERRSRLHAANTLCTAANENMSPTTLTGFGDFSPISPNSQPLPLFTGMSFKDIDKRMARLEEASQLVKNRMDGLEAAVQSLKTNNTDRCNSASSVKGNVDAPSSSVKSNHTVVAKDRKWTPEEAKLLHQAAQVELSKADVEQLAKDKTGYDLLNVIVALTSANQSLSAKLSTLTAIASRNTSPARSIFNELLNTAPSVRKSLSSPSHRDSALSFVPINIGSADDLPSKSSKGAMEPSEAVNTKSPPRTVEVAVGHSPRGGASPVRKRSVEADREETSPDRATNGFLKESSPIRISCPRNTITASMSYISGLANGGDDTASPSNNKTAILDDANSTLGITHLSLPLDLGSKTVDSTNTIEDEPTPRQSRVVTPKASVVNPLLGAPRQVNRTEGKEWGGSPPTLDVVLPASSSLKKKRLSDFGSIGAGKSHTDFTTGFSEATRKILLGDNNRETSNRSSSTKYATKSVRATGATISTPKSKLNGGDEKQNVRQLIRERLREKERS
ncbi:hypothetical protein SeMB42_g07222 [Synchytrium endobioticum]|uniref:Uncharacterized protein n=1 Tax=Synchytrium endobioticum TaxID=286115 RepID=A0A507C6A5_9FUNG|nr:hypothetical protein SeMB42_g07222 [Synchytrium endobioticum]TPX44281.1 hypothetical protein SeLEV6574_g04589 [Synchytrium endobioticum]